MAALKVMRSLVTSGRHQTETRGKPRHEEMGFGLQGFHEGVVSGFQHAYIESFTKIGYVWQEIVGVCKDLRWGHRVQLDLRGLLAIFRHGQVPSYLDGSWKKQACKLVLNHLSRPNGDETTGPTTGLGT